MSFKKLQIFISQMTKKLFKYAEKLLKKMALNQFWLKKALKE